MSEEDPNLTETQRAMLAKRQKEKEEEEAWFEQYMEEVAERRAAEAAELEELKQRIVSEERRLERQEEDAQRQEYAELAAERHKAEEEERKAKAEAAKQKKKHEREKKQAMMQGGMMPASAQGKPKKSLKINKKSDGEGEENAEEEAVDNKDDEKAAAKAAYMAKYQEPLGGLDEMDVFGLRTRVKALHKQLAELEMARYDLEQRTKIQTMDLNELNERQKQQLRAKAVKQGLDPEEFANAKHPQKIKVANAYDRVIDSRGYDDRKNYYLKTPPPPKAVAHGTARPPPEWGRTYNAEEIIAVRKHLEENPPKYQELEPVEGAKPPVKPVPLSIPKEDEPAPPPPAAAAPPPAEAEAAAE